ncbi:MAG TPA: hypothetical protein VK923_15760 [Euzebyales bacterium]|nr:hypothetical protein [Euzebyales bacterium]
MSSVASSVTPIRGHAGGGPVEQLQALVTDPVADPEAFDTVAATHPEAWAAATVLAALARIVDDDRDGTAGAQLDAVAGGDVDDDALTIAGQLGVTVHARVSAVALSSAARRHSDVLAMTHGVDVVDDVTALLLSYRATALARVGMVVGAREAADRVLRSRRSHPTVRAFARRQRHAAWSDDDMV